METKNHLKNHLLTYISLRIKNRREEVGLTQLELAESVGLTRTSITNIESGKTQVQLFTLIEISEKLKVKLDYFFLKEFVSDKNEVEKIDYTPYFNEDIDKDDEKYISDLIDSI
jgi:transcriptional regulator with XRE-family HTH domain